jgi:hypothetical protein
MLQECQSGPKKQDSNNLARTSSDSLTTGDGVSLGNSDMLKMFEFMDQLQQLSTSDPTKFKQLVSDMATKLKDAASKSTDGNEKQFLTSLADSFEASAKSGQLEPPKPPQGEFYNRYSARHGHSPSPPPSLSLMSSGTQDLLNSLFEEVSKASSSSISL